MANTTTEAIDKALLAGADIKDMNNILSRTGQSTFQEVSSTDPFFNPESGGYDSGYFEEQPDNTIKHGNGYSAKYATIVAEMSQAQDPVKKYKQVREDLLLKGESYDLNDLKEKIRGMKSQEDLDLVNSILADPKLGSEQKMDMIANIPESNKAPVDVDKEYIEYSAANSKTNTKAEERVQIKLMNTAEEINSSKQLMSNIVDEEFMQYVAENKDTGDVAKLLGDTAAYTVLPGHEAAYKGIFEETFPEIDFGKLDYLAVGSAKDKVKKYVDTLPLDQRVEKFRQVLSAMKNHMGVLTDDNMIERYYVAQDFLNLFDPTEDHGTGDVILGNIIGVLDLLPVASFANKARKMLRTNKADLDIESVAGMKAVSAPGQAQDLLTHAVKTKDPSLLEALGTTKGEIVNDLVLPKAVGQERRAGPDLDFAEEKFEEIFGGRSGQLNLREIEKIRFTDDTDAAWAEIAQAEPAVHLSKSTLKDTPYGMEAGAVVGRTKNVGFSSLDEANEYAQTFEEAADSYHILFRDPTTQNIVEYAGDLGKTYENVSEWFVELRREFHFNRKNVIGLEEENFVGFGGKAGRWNDKAAQWDQPIVRGESAAVNAEAYFKDAFNEILKPFTNLKITPSKQQRVLQVVDYGDTNGKWFEADDLYSMGLKQDEVKGYLAFRRASDLAYYANNHRLHKRLKGEGYKAVQVGEYQNIAKPVAPNQVHKLDSVYDPVKDEVIKLTPKRIEEYKQQGLNFMQMSHPISRGVDEALGLVVKGDNVKDLPKFVLKYREGYVPRYYEGAFKVIKRNVKNTSGHVTTVKFAKTRSEAERMKRELQRDAPEGVVYDTDLTRETKGLPEDSDLDFYKTEGQMFFSKRGDELLGSGEKRTVQNIYESMGKMIGNISRHMAMDDWIEGETLRWMNSYSKFLPDGLPAAQVPLRASDLRKPLGSEIKQHSRAVAHLERINHLRGVHMGLGVNAWRKGIIKLADMFDSVGMSKISEKLLDPKSVSTLVNINRSPADILKSSAFIAFIATKPARQLIINANQIAVYGGVDHGMKYFLNAGSKGYMAESMALDIGLAYRNIDNPVAKKAVDTLRKSLGLDKKEWEDLVTQFEKSGLAQNIDGHQVATALAIDRADSVLGGGKLTTAAKWAKEYLIKAPLEGSKKIGFKTGEYKNVSAAWLVARNRMRAKNPNIDFNDPVVIERLSAEASDLSLNMNRSGELAYQKGALSAAMQFFAIQQKTIQLLLPTQWRAGNKAFSNAEKRRIAMLMTGMYGSAAFGLKTVVEDMLAATGVELDEEWKRAVHEGAVEYLINHVATKLTGEKQDLNIAESFSPVSGYSMLFDENGFIGSLARTAMLRPDGLEMIDFLGASKNLVGKPKQLFETAENLFLQAKVDDLSAEEVGVLLKDATFMIGGLSDYFKASLYGRLGRKVSSKGYVGYEVTDLETEALKWFGIHDKANLDLNEYTFDIIKSRETNDDTLRADLDEDAKKLFDQMSKFITHTADGLDKQDTNKYLMRTLSMIANMGYEPKDKWYVINRLATLIDQDARRVPAEQRLAAEIWKGYGQGWITDKDKYLTKLKNLSDFPGKDNLINFLEQELPE